MTPLRVVVLGLGDIGSAVAHRLFREGMAVMLHDDPKPATTRRRMAFADAAFDGRAMLDGIEARSTADLGGVQRLLESHKAIPVYLADLGPLLQIVDPQVLVDARMRKHAARAAVIRGLATLTIGLGPGCKAGQTCDMAIETSWDQLGRVIYHGPTLPLAGEPREIGGHARERYVYAPNDGVFYTRSTVGDRVEAGQVVAMLGHTALEAPIGGTVRGLTHDGVPVTVRTKVIEIDPRAEDADISGIGERPRRIAEGVAAAIASEPGQRLLSGSS